MKRLTVIVASALFGAVALTGCSSNAVVHYSDSDTSASVETKTSDNLPVAEKVTGLDNAPSWIVYVEGGKFENGGYKGAVHCNDGQHGYEPIPLSETVTVQLDQEHGDLIYTFAEGSVPPGLIFSYDGSSVVVKFNDSSAMQYRVKGDIANPDYIEDYYSDPTSMVSTC